MSLLQEQGALTLRDRLAPILTLLLLAILMLLPVGSGASNVAMPHLVLIATFYWTVRHPVMLPYGACAGIGLVLDLWLSVPLGLNMMMLLLTRLFIISQHRYFRGQTRALQWAIFAATAFMLYGFAWILTAVAERQWLPVQPVITQWLITAFLYAPFTLVLARLRRVVR